VSGGCFPRLRGDGRASVGEGSPAGRADSAAGRREK